MTDNGRKQVCVVGSGRWGTVVAKLIGENVKRSRQFHEQVNFLVHDEAVNGRSLSNIINKEHVNEKYLPGIKLPENVVASSNVKEVSNDADIIVFVLRQQSLLQVCQEMEGNIKKDVIGISLIKSLYHGADSCEKLLCASNIIKERLGIDVAVLMGPNLADEVAKEKISETTIACHDPVQLCLWQELFASSYFIVRPSPYVEEVELCGALKNIVATASGIAEGLKCGENTLAAVIRLGFLEMKLMIKILLQNDVHEEVYWEPCAFADVIATCYGGVTKRISSLFVTSGKALQVIERDHFSGMVLEGPQNAIQVYNWLKTRGIEEERFPLFSAVYAIFQENKQPVHLIDILKSSF